MNGEKPRIAVAMGDPAGISPEIAAKLLASPSVREEAVFFYKFLQKPTRPIGSFDERDYYLGEFALIAGTACRFLALRDESRQHGARGHPGRGRVLDHG